MRRFHLLGLVVPASLLALAVGPACSTKTRDFGSGGGSTTSSTSTSTTSSGGGGGSGPCAMGDKRDCYDGPMGTAGKGICKAGKQACDTNGMWGACMGEVKPAPFDDCATPEDDDCDGTAAPKCTGDTVWQYGFGSPLSDGLFGAGVDKGQVLFAGQIGAQTNNGLMGFGNSDAVFGAVDAATGSMAWARSFGSQDDEQGYAIRAVPSGYVVLGTFATTFDLGCGALTSKGQGDIFLAKLDKNGKCTNAASYGTPDDERAISMAVDPMGNVAIIGSSSPPQGSSQVLVAKFAPDLGVVWAKRVGMTTGETQGIGVAFDTSNAMGDVVVSGAFKGTLDFGGTSHALTSGMNVDAFVAKLDGMGVGLWSAQGGMSDTGGALGTRLVVDPVDGTVWAGGLFVGAVDFGTGNPVSDQGGYLVAFDPKGKPTLLRSYGGGGSGFTGTITVALDPQGHPVICGSFSSPMDFGNAVTLAPSGNSDAWVAKLDRKGDGLWARSVGVASGTIIANDCSADDSGVSLVGQFDPSFDAGLNMPILSQGGQDVFVARFRP
jgi:hypothetical protein